MITGSKNNFNRKFPEYEEFPLKVVDEEKYLSKSKIQPKRPEMPKMLEMPKIPEIADMVEMSEIPEMPKIPQIADMVEKSQRSREEFKIFLK